VQLAGVQPDTVGIPTLTSLNLPVVSKSGVDKAFRLKDLTSTTPSIASMSLSGDSRAEFCPERIDLFCQLSHVSGVVHDHISGEHAILATGLSGNPGLGFGTGEPVA
jgi:hypothetical protein